MAFNLFMCLGGIKIIGMTLVSHKATDVSKPCPIPKPPPQQRLGRTQFVPGNLTIRPIGRGLEIFRALRSNSTTLLPCKMFILWILWDWTVETGKFLSIASSFMEFNGCFFTGDVQLFFIRFICICFCGCLFQGMCFFVEKESRNPQLFVLRRAHDELNP